MPKFLAFVKLSSTGSPGKAEIEAEDVMAALAILRTKTRVQSTADIYEYELFKIVDHPQGGEGLVSVAKKMATAPRPQLELARIITDTEETPYSNYETQAA